MYGQIPVGGNRPLPFQTTSYHMAPAHFFVIGADGREIYEHELSNLVSKSSRLKTLYHREMGKVHARHYFKEFRKIGLQPGWFAPLQGMIIASGFTRENAEKSMKKVAPVEKIQWITIFQLKG